jgi:DNA-binding NarL/FixJ family response regulator
VTSITAPRPLPGPADPRRGRARCASCWLIDNGEIGAAQRLGAPKRASGDEFTNREREVLTLMAARRSNREIASQLVISQATVEVHIKHILRKLGLRSRTQAAMWFADHQSKSAREIGS